MSKKLRVLIVDDEPLERERICTMLNAHEDVEVVGEAGDGRSAIDHVNELHPDLVFLDVRIPEVDGLQVLQALPLEGRPQIVFCAAHGEHAVRAFEVDAADYLVKPFDRHRIRMTLDRVRRRVLPGEARLEKTLEELLERWDRRTQRTRLLVKSAGRIVFVPFEEIEYCEAAGNYVKVHAAGKVHLRRETMSKLEKLLASFRFVRVHRSTIVNLDRIRELRPLPHGEYAVVLQNGEQLTMSRGYREKLQERFGISF